MNISSMWDYWGHTINVRKLPALFQSSDSSFSDNRLSFLDFSEKSKNEKDKENSVPNVPINKAWLQSKGQQSVSPNNVSFFGVNVSSILEDSNGTSFIYDVSDNDDDIVVTPQKKQRRTI